MILVQRRGDLLPLLELVLNGHHEAVENGPAEGPKETSRETKFV